MVQEFNILSIAGESGTGTSSQIPFYIHEAGYAKQGRLVGIVCKNSMQCIEAANVQVEQLGTFMGGKVGYSTPFDSNCSHLTEVKYLCPRMVLQEVLVDPLLSEYSVIIIDDAEAKMIEMDIIISILKKILKKRFELRIILLSNSTVDEILAFEYLKSSTKDTKAIAMTIDSRTYPVQEFFLENPCADYLSEALRLCGYIHENENPGDIIVFLTTQEEIESLATILLEHSFNGIQVLPIVGNQVLYQSAIDSISGQVRKIIISNATVSSIVGSNIRYVIDSGFESLLVFNTKSGIKEVLKAPASTETASNRAKNAGLNGPGKCFRLYTQTDHKSGPKNVPITNW